MKTIKDLNKFESTLPYASEIFGTYTPIIGWKSKRILDRYSTGPTNQAIIDTLKDHFEIQTNAPEYNFSIAKLKPVSMLPQTSKLLQIVANDLKNKEYIMGTRPDWDGIDSALPSFKDYLDDRLLKAYQFSDRISIGESHPAPETYGSPYSQTQIALQKYLQNESDAKIAGVLFQLYESGYMNELKKIFYKNINTSEKEEFFKEVEKINGSYEDPYLTFNANGPENAGQGNNLSDNVSLSPIGIVHLFRQYFFEFDTFLGSPVGHIWLSPNSSVELVESSTRKTIIEKTYESSFETITKNEDTSVAQDDLSESVKTDNRQDMKLGATVSGGSSGLTGLVSSYSASASFSMDKSQQEAKENVHKRMRQQTTKLSSEIRENFKSTFKTVSEITDTNSKRYLIKNNKKELVNYELRRKMRQVGVQVQDIGSYLCWQTFVDNPGEAIGLANLVHFAQSADTSTNPEPQKMPTPQSKSKTIQSSVMWFKSIGRLTTETIVPETGYKVRDISSDRSLINNDGGIMFQVGIGGLTVDIQRKTSGVNGEPVVVDVIRISGTEAEHTSIPFTITYILDPLPEYIAEIKTANDLLIAGYNAKNEIETQKALVEAAKERIKFASTIKSRPYEELREEERIIVYRKLIASLMGESFKSEWLSVTANGLKQEDIKNNNERAHILSELITSIFDVDKMLYFVAPEWWKPRTKPSHQFASDFGINQSVPWSDTPRRADNYFITEDSSPAVMGSSLGWLLQLDGDKLRNAFLNAPWVKATIPIRPGKERAAIIWLQNSNSEGASGLNVQYIPQGTAEQINNELAELRSYYGRDAFTVEDALFYLCDKVAKKHSYEMNGVPNDDNTVSPLPIEKVYEHGFKPLQGGFIAKGKPFEVFDQWTEVVPTDQVVAVSVKYDPLTGMQI